MASISGENYLIEQQDITRRIKKMKLKIMEETKSTQVKNLRNNDEESEIPEYSSVSSYMMISKKKQKKIFKNLPRGLALS
jgi:hypothetical protein